MKYDESAVNYCERKNVKFVLYDTDTGDILQFGCYSSRLIFSRKCEGMFPKRNTRAISVDGYKQLFTKKKKKDETESES